MKITLHVIPPATPMSTAEFFDLIRTALAPVLDVKIVDVNGIAVSRAEDQDPRAEEWR